MKFADIAGLLTKKGRLFPLAKIHSCMCFNIAKWKSIHLGTKNTSHVESGTVEHERHGAFL